MKPIHVLVGVALLFLTQSGYGMEMAEVRSSEQLARFIFSMTRDNVPTDKLLKGIESTERLRIPDYETEIPIREVFATITIERFGDKVEKRLFESNKTYATRAICAFRDSSDQVWRFTVSIMEEKQYSQLKRFLEEQLKNENRK